MSPASGTFEIEFPFAPSRWSISTAQPFFLLYLGELGGLRGREKGSEGYQRECLLNWCRLLRLSGSESSLLQYYMASVKLEVLELGALSFTHKSESVFIKDCLEEVIGSH